MDPRTSIEKALMVQELYQDCTNRLESTIQHKCCWQPQIEDSLKLNVDSAIFFDHQKVEIEAILKNNKGDTIMATSLLENDVSQSRNY